MTILDGYIYVKGENQIEAHYYDKHLGTYENMKDAYRAIASATEGRPTHILGATTPETIDATELRRRAAA